MLWFTPSTRSAFSILTHQTQQPYGVATSVTLILYMRISQVPLRWTELDLNSMEQGEILFPTVCLGSARMFLDGSTYSVKVGHP